MKKLNRSEKEYGGGSGRERFGSDLFRVVFWKLSNGERTTIEIKATHAEINFDGDKTFLSDSDCLHQLNTDEIYGIISAAKDAAYEKGRASKVEELKKVLEI